MITTVSHFIFNHYWYCRVDYLLVLVDFEILIHEFDIVYISYRFDIVLFVTQI